MINSLRNIVDKYRENKAEETMFSHIPKNISIAVCNQKGGCGKTTTSINLSACLAEKGLRVLLIDMDPQAHATLGIGLVPEEYEKTVYDVLIKNTPLDYVIKKTAYPNLDIAPANSLLSGAQLQLADILGRETVLKMALRKLKLISHYDYIILDCSPSLNLVTINALASSEHVLVPIQTHYYSLEGMKELFSTIEIVKDRLNFDLNVLGILPTLFDRRMKINHQVLNEIREYFKGMVFKTIIHNNVKLCEAPIYKKPINIYAPYSKGAHEYRLLAEEVLSLTEDAKDSCEKEIQNAEPSQTA